MSHLFRFIGERVGDKSWRLADDEAHHLAKVLRLEVGAEVEVTDGKGRWAQGVVRSSGSKSAEIEATSEGVDAPSSMPISFAVAALKPGDVDEILPALTELGVDHVHVFQQRGVAKLRMNDKAVERWERILTQAVKQCKRSYVPTLSAHESLNEMLRHLRAPEKLVAWKNTTKLLLEPDSAVPVTKYLAGKRPTALFALAGGERGLQADELAALKANEFTPVRLGPHVLRSVTASVATLAALSMFRESVSS